MLEAARARMVDAESAWAGAQRAEQSARNALQRVDAEAAALAELVGPDPNGSPLIDLIEIADGAAHALAAALGDDLLGSLDTAAP